MRHGAVFAGLLLLGPAFSAVHAQTTRPRISAVVNAASYSSGSISPGEMIVIFGTNLGPASLVGLRLNAQGKVSTSLSDVTVLFDENAAPLVYVSERQIAAMVPYAVAGKLAVQVHVTYRGVASDPVSNTVSPAVPGVFTGDASGKGQAAATNSDGSFNSSSNPAAPGTWITFYLTGEGSLEPSGYDGTIAAGATRVVLPVSVKVAGRAARVLYAGSAPGNVLGFAQINAVIPSDLPYGGDLPLVVEIGGQVSRSEVTVAVAGQVAPKPSAPANLSAVVTGANQVTLTWTLADGSAVTFHIERRTGSDAFAEIGTVPGSSSTFVDRTAAAGASYQYRVRAESDYGLSSYSATAAATSTLVQLEPPSNLRAAAVNQSQIVLTWSTTNTSAARFQIERKIGSAGTYTLISSVPVSQNSYHDTGLASRTTYFYRMRSQGTVAFSGYSGEVSATTLAVLKTVFLIHGINQDSCGMRALAGSLTGSLGIDLTRFRIDAGFDFSECADSPWSCASNCSISLGAQKFARYINDAKPPGDIILLGFSMGGLIARDLIVNNWAGVLNSRKVAALITLGSPVLGYPYTYVDRLYGCTPLLLEMDGNWRSRQDEGIVVLSEYLLGVVNRWDGASFPGGNREWLAASGRSCNQPVRRGGDGSTGCRDRNRYSDGVVCDDSATYNINKPTAVRPTRYWQDPSGIYVHTNAWLGLGSVLVLCGNSGDEDRNPLLSDPLPSGPLFIAIREVINGL